MSIHKEATRRTIRFLETMKRLSPELAPAAEKLARKIAKPARSKLAAAAPTPPATPASN